MWTRSELKERGKASFRKFYAGAVISCLLIGMVTFVVEFRDMQNQDRAADSYITDIQNARDIEDYQKIAEKANPSSTYSIASRMISDHSFLMIGVFIMLANLMVLNPLHVGVRHYFMRNRSESTRLGAIFYGFKGSRYFHICWVMFLRDLYTALWSLLLVIPGIVKSYEYRMIPYILAENSELSTSRTFAISKSMMKHNKWATFVLDLSYILWIFADTFTLGLIGIFWLSPYVIATESELYAVLRGNVLDDATAESYELHGFYAS